MNKKERTIDALIKTGNEYDSPEGHEIKLETCGLCVIHYNSGKGVRDYTCKGCPHADKAGEQDCLAALTHLKNRGFVKEHNPMRAQYLWEAAIICKHINAKYFTAKGWTWEAFARLRALDRVIANKSK